VTVSMEPLGPPMGQHSTSSTTMGGGWAPQDQNAPIHDHYQDQSQDRDQGRGRGQDKPPQVPAPAPPMPPLAPRSASAGVSGPSGQRADVTTGGAAYTGPAARGQVPNRICVAGGGPGTAATARRASSPGVMGLQDRAMSGRGGGGGRPPLMAVSTNSSALQHPPWGRRSAPGGPTPSQAQAGECRHPHPAPPPCL
jgi:hypothetical protein